MPYILLVDDNHDLADNLKLILEIEGFVVRVADSGTSALEQAKIEAPSLIIADVVMAGGDGFGLLQEIRGTPDFADIPFVFVSARKDEVQHGLDLGANDFVTKPFAIEDLLAIVKRYLK